MKEAQEQRLQDLKEQAENARKPMPEHAQIDRRAWLLDKSMERLNHLDRGLEEFRR